MIEKLPQSKGNVLGYAVRGQLREEDYQKLDTDIQTLRQQHSQLRLMFNLEAMSGYDLNALDDDLRMARYSNDVERMAVVSDNRLFEWMSAATDTLIDVDIRHFDPDEVASAWKWLQEQ